MLLPSTSKVTDPVPQDHDYDSAEDFKKPKKKIKNCPNPPPPKKSARKDEKPYEIDDPNFDLLFDKEKKSISLKIKF